MAQQPGDGGQGAQHLTGTLLVGEAGRLGEHRGAQEREESVDGGCLVPQQGRLGTVLALTRVPLGEHAALGLLPGRLLLIDAVLLRLLLLGGESVHQRTERLRLLGTAHASFLPMVLHRNVYISAFMRAACSLVAAPPCPPSMFSQERTSAPRDSSAAVNLRA